MNSEKVNAKTQDPGADPPPRSKLPAKAATRNVFAREVARQSGPREEPPAIVFLRGALRDSPDMAVDIVAAALKSAPELADDIQQVATQLAPRAAADINRLIGARRR